MRPRLSTDLDDEAESLLNGDTAFELSAISTGQRPKRNTANLENLEQRRDCIDKCFDIVEVD